MKICLIEKKDVTKLTNLMLALDSHFHKNSSFEEKRIAANKYIQEKQAWGCFLNGDIVGYVLVEYFGKGHHNFPKSMFFSELFVLEEYRKKKIGSELVKYVLKIKFPKDYSYFSLTYSPKERNLKRFYQNLGFKFDRVLDSGNLAMKKNK